MSLLVLHRSGGRRFPDPIILLGALLETLGISADVLYGVPVAFRHLMQRLIFTH